MSKKFLTGAVGGSFAPSEFAFRSIENTFGSYDFKSNSKVCGQKFFEKPVSRPSRRQIKERINNALSQSKEIESKKVVVKL